jgi:hypothetical protein
MVSRSVRDLVDEEFECDFSWHCMNEYCSVCIKTVHIRPFFLLVGLREFLYHYNPSALRWGSMYHKRTQNKIQNGIQVNHKVIRNLHHDKHVEVMELGSAHHACHVWAMFFAVQKSLEISIWKNGYNFIFPSQQLTSESLYPSSQYQWGVK